MKKHLYLAIYLILLPILILDSAVQDAKAIQDFQLESLMMGADHSQMVKAAPIIKDYGSKDCVDLASSTAEFRIILDANSETYLAPYKHLLDWGTYEGQDWSAFNTIPKSRYDTFKASFDHFEQINGKVIVELGTSRSFNHGGLIGCNSDDKSYWMPDSPETWDWGAGFFTRMAATCLHHLNPEIHTVDITKSHLERCKIMTEEFRCNIEYHLISSEDFLNHCSLNLDSAVQDAKVMEDYGIKNCVDLGSSTAEFRFKNGIDLLYLDTGDMTPIEPTALLQLAEVKIIVERNLLSDNGWILIDDVRNQTPKKFGDTSGLGKSKYAIPYLLENGFEIVMDEYQVILQRSKRI